MTSSFIFLSNKKVSVFIKVIGGQSLNWFLCTLLLFKKNNWASVVIGHDPSRDRDTHTDAPRNAQIYLNLKSALHRASHSATLGLYPGDLIFVPVYSRIWRHASFLLPPTTTTIDPQSNLFSWGVNIFINADRSFLQTCCNKTSGLFRAREATITALDSMSKQVEENECFFDWKRVSAERRSLSCVSKAAVAMFYGLSPSVYATPWANNWFGKNDRTSVLTLSKTTLGIIRMRQSGACNDLHSPTRRHFLRA